ncbi:MAG: hypothetical protein ABSH52_24745 [Terriglobia bacterium]|jgi:hypothetical protein
MATVSNSVETRGSLPQREDSSVQRRRILLETLTIWDAIFPGQERRDLELIGRAYALALEGLSPEQLALACRKVMERARFFPTVAEILELAGEPLVQSLELGAARAWESLLLDFDEWGPDRTSTGQPLRKEKIVLSRRAQTDCKLCGGTDWCSVEQDGVHWMKPCPCTEPRKELVPQLPEATLYALRTLGSYGAVREEVGGPRASFLHKQFVQEYVYYLRTSRLRHLPAAKSDAALLAEIEQKAGLRLLKG